MKNASQKYSKDWVSEAEWARIAQSPLSARRLLYAIAMCVVVLIVWAGFAPLDEIARGDGKVITSQQLQTIQSLDGGLVTDIVVREGQIVEAGQVLLKVDSTRSASNLAENQTQYYALTAEVARLIALTNETSPQFPDELVTKAPERLQHEIQLYRNSLAELNEQLAVHAEQQQQRQQELIEAKAALLQYNQTFALTNQELTVTKPLRASGAVSDIDILRLEREVARAKGEASRAEANVARAESALQEARNKLKEIKLTVLNRWRNQLSESRAKLAGLSEVQAGLVDMVQQAEVKSPIRGTIQRLHINTVGGVLTPGRDILDIVPLDDKLLIEARISPRDIAFIQIGQPAMIRISAYDFAIFGGLQASVSHISADTVTDEQDNTYYVVRLSTASQKLDDKLNILPGMTVQVDIVTGKRTVLSYLLKPLLRAKSNAMTER
ncbi:HlyD family type I secretion periplasmic adaptor subunit [Rheinheimera baltica]|uniref:HlyD family type I secretion periplasmic adaptor subunit n=1 Tax=Rheinheimera baltica TaxID=67576 RepID=UPI00273E0CCC|nr:HlyD family type I secretion periplasmic adaptor subunit [Rheinheimera baltica]MDP5150325.1 HlyD family type I secretion periplasmic adaptor subunit [Rheinheimera baltica]